MPPSEHYVPTGPVLPKAQAFAGYVNRSDLFSNITKRPPAETRRITAQLLAIAPPAAPSGRTHDYMIPVAGAEILGRLYAPQNSPATALVVWCHGGGFVFGSVAEYDGFARRFVLGTGAAVLSIDYRLAPEHKFPVPVNDVVAAIRWAARNRKMMLGHETPLFVCGDSAGANLVTVAAMLLRGSDTPIAGQIIAYPNTDADPRLLQGFVPPFLTAQEILWFWDWYIPDDGQRQDPRFSPMRAPDLSGMPPTLVFTAEHDLLTEQTELYGRRLEKEGARVQMRRFPGQVHGFLTAELFANEEGAAALKEIDTFIKTAG